MLLRCACVLPLLVMLGACSTYTTPRYSISADTNVALRALGATGIAVGRFSEPPFFDTSCRAVGPLAPPDGMTHAQYIRKALEDELKIAGVHAVGSPRVLLSGTVKDLDFSSMEAVTAGLWFISVTVTSSNGKSLSASERYGFESGFFAETACKQTAEAFMPAVQNLVGKIVRSPEFETLLR